jgi:hypothetical protein
LATLASGGSAMMFRIALVFAALVLILILVADADPLYVFRIWQTAIP